MSKIPSEELRELQVGLERELKETEAKIEPLQQRVREIRNQLEAIDTLLKPLTEMSDGVPGPGIKLAETVLALGADDGNFTPTDAYWIPILESVKELGGRARADEVLNLVEKKMAKTLKQKDRELLPSGISVRWRNRAQWQRQNMVNRGLIASNSPRGIWEITSEGREWLRLEEQKLKKLLEKYSVPTG